MLTDTSITPIDLFQNPFGANYANVVSENVNSTPNVVRVIYSKRQYYHLNAFKTELE